MNQLQKTKKFTMLRALWEAWKRLGRRLADYQVRGLLIVFYFLILAPFALAVRWKSDPLGIKGTHDPGWESTPAKQIGPMDEARRQF